MFLLTNWLVWKNYVFPYCIKIYSIDVTLLFFPIQPPISFEHQKLSICLNWCSHAFLYLFVTFIQEVVSQHLKEKLLNKCLLNQTEGNKKKCHCFSEIQESRQKESDLSLLTKTVYTHKYKNIMAYSTHLEVKHHYFQKNIKLIISKKN